MMKSSNITLGIKGEPAKGIIFQDREEGIKLTYDPNWQIISFWDDELAIRKVLCWSKRVSNVWDMFVCTLMAINQSCSNWQKKGFQIWTADALRENGFSAENAPYYAVMRFDPAKPVPFDQPINLHKRLYTQVARIQPLSDFIGIR